MATINVSREIKETLDELVREEQRSEGELLESLVANYRLNQALDRIQKVGGPLAKKFGLETEDDVERFFG